MNPRQVTATAELHAQIGADYLNVRHKMHPPSKTGLTKLSNALADLQAIFAFVVVATAFAVAWYVESFKTIFISRGIAEPGKVWIEDISFSLNHGLKFRYGVSDLPDCQITGYLYPWRDAGRSLSDDYLRYAPRP